MLTIRLLGPVEATETGRSIPIRGLKQRILLARLAIAGGRPVHPDILVEDLWESRPPADAQHALQAHASRLRAALPVPLEFSHGGYLLTGDALEVDATTFQDRATVGRQHLVEGRPNEAATELGSALALWRGPALADLQHVAGLRPFAVRLEELRASAHTDRIDADLARGENLSLVGELQAMVAAEPAQEKTWCQLVLALAGAGRRAEALDACRAARSALLEHQGIDPGPELVALHQAVLNDEVPTTGRGTAAHATPAQERRQPEETPAGGAPVPPAVARRATGAWTGREDELAALHQAWDRREHGPQLVTLTGEPGIGKTRLAAEFAGRCARAGARVLFGRCEESLAVPYQPFLEMLRTEVELTPADELAVRLGPDRALLEDVFPGLAAAAPDGTFTEQPARSDDADLERYRTFEAVAGWLAAASREAPLLLVLDDLQWADPPTLGLLQHLLRTPQDVATCIVATYRDREHEDGEPIAQLVAPLLRPSETTTQLAISSLPPDGVRELLATELRSAGVRDTPSPDTTGWVERASGGNPLFVVELARQIADDVNLATADREPPAGLRQVVEQRVRRLPGELPVLLRVAAVVGRTFDPQVLQEVEDLDDDGLDELLIAASFTRLIERTSGPHLEYTFSHDVVRTTLYDSVPPLRRARLHRRVGEALERRHLGDLRSHYSELAHHFSAAAEVSGSAEAVRYLTLAGDAATDQGAPAVAAAHYGRALDLLDPDLDPGGYCDLLTARGRAEFQAGRPSYRDTLLTSARLALDTGDANRLAEAAILNAREWWSGTPGLDHERLRVIESALAVVDIDDPATRAKLLGARAVEKVRDDGGRDEALDDIRGAVRLARHHGDPWLLTHALAEMHAVGSAAFADPRGCVRVTEELVGLARSLDDPGAELTAAISHAQATAAVGDVATSDAFLALAEPAAIELRQPSRLWMVRAWAAMRRGLRGDLERAEREVAAACELGTATGQPQATTWFVGQMFALRWMAGRLPEIMDEVERHVSPTASSMTDDHSTGQVAYPPSTPAWRAALALALAESGRTTEAEQILDEFVLTDLADLPRDTLWLHALAFLTGVSVRLGHADAARLLHRSLLPYSGLLIDNGTINSGPVDLHLGLLAQVADADRRKPGGQGRADQHLRAAIEQCRRIDAPLWLARAQSAHDQDSGADATGAGTGASQPGAVTRRS